MVLKMSLLSALYSFILTKQRGDIPLYNDEISHWWKQGNIVDEYHVYKTYVAIRGAIVWFRHLLSNNAVIYCENITEISNTNRVIKMGILFDDRGRYMFNINMQVSDFYNFIYGNFTSDADKYNIDLYGRTEKELSLIQDGNVVCDDIDLQYMFQMIPNTEHIEFFTLLKQDIAHKYDCLKQLDCLECLPLELIELIQEYANHNIT